MSSSVEHIRTNTSIPEADASTGRRVVAALIRDRSLLSALAAMRDRLGDIFRVTLGRFRPIFVVGPNANRSVLVTDRDSFQWRTEEDPVTRLLRGGVLVVDGEQHHRLRSLMDPTLHRKQALAQVGSMVEEIDHVTSSWPVTSDVAEGPSLNMLDEMRKISLLILMRASFKVDFRDDLERMWNPIIASIRFISPGVWVLWPDILRPRYRTDLRLLDEYLYRLVADRRRSLQANGGQAEASDLLGQLLLDASVTDDLARDQLLTMLIAGHDTSTALLAWTIYLLGRHPEARARATAEVDAVLRGRAVAAEHLAHLPYLDAVIKESLRMYPPIHVGNRRVSKSTALNECPIAQGSRLMYSIYLTHRHPELWEDPADFRPERFSQTSGATRVPFSYIPFGGGPRNCIGAAFAQVQAKVVLARLLSGFEFFYLPQKVRPRMGATLEPAPGVMVRVLSRKAS